MPIIINEFEIVAEPPALQAAPDASREPPAGTPPALHPEDIVRIERHNRARMLRLWAD